MAYIPAPIFFCNSFGAIGMMRHAGMNDTQIANVLIDVRAAAISEERMRVEWVAIHNPPQPGIRANDILEQIAPARTRSEKR